VKIAFTLNGQPVEVQAAPDRRVVDLLREDLGLAGTKEACGMGECGACSVLVDGVSRLSCLMLAAQLTGRSLVTIEGLGQGERGRRLEAAFARHGAVQCGFCTPGMIVAAEDLLSREPSPSREQVRAGLAGNLCRCTGYQMIVDAVRAAADGEDEK